MAIDLEKVSVRWKLIDIGYAADKEVKELLPKGKISEKAALEFRMKCKSVLC